MAGAPEKPAAFSRFVALGDSTTEGLVDLHPAGGYRGWADRLAEMLAVGNPELRYANLAIRGRKLPQIRAEQLEPALALRPDLASVLGGVNDILRPRVDLEARGDDLEAIVAALREGGARVLVLNAPDLTHSITIASASLRRRLDAFNRRVDEIVERYGADLVDLESDDLRHPSLWSPDRLHASSIGHERIAALAADALDVTPLSESWRHTLPPPQRRAAPLRIAGEAYWAGRHLAPWLVRRLRGVSSGDGLPPKRPELEPVSTESA